MHFDVNWVAGGVRETWPVWCIRLVPVASGGQPGGSQVPQLALVMHLEGPGGLGNCIETIIETPVGRRQKEKPGTGRPQALGG